MESTSNIITGLSNEITQKINDCPEMCLECNSQKECTKCNKLKNYYPIELTSQITPSQTLTCITETIKKSQYPDFYFNSESESFKPCYETCGTCYGKGDQDFHNCENCTTGYIFHPDYEEKINCVPRPNPYYYINHGRYILSDSEICPEDFKFLVEVKSKCIEDCKNDDKYKYTYDELCYETPPENTNDDDNDFKCLDNISKCIKTTKKLYTKNDTLTNIEIEKLTLKYAKEYEYTNNHVSIYENDIYKISIYKKGDCAFDLGAIDKIIDFGICYNDIKAKNHFDESTNLIIVYIETKPGKEAYKKKPSYALYHPQTGKSLNFEEECKNQKLTIQNNITEAFNNSKVSLKEIKIMADYGLDLFDPMNPFYSDLCTHYPDILKKDVPIKKRALAYYPDIELCEDNCEMVSVFLNNLTAKCECSIENLGKIDKIKENAFYQYGFGQYEEFFYLTNINVIKCYKDLFKSKYFRKAYGGFIIMGFIIIQIACTVLYFMKGKEQIRQFIFSLTNKYINYLKNKKPDNGIEIYDIQQPLNKEENEKISMPPKKIIKSPRKSVDALSLKTQKNNTNSNLIPNNDINTNNSKRISYMNNSGRENLNTKNTSKFKTQVQTKNLENNKIINNLEVSSKLSYNKENPDNFLINEISEYNIEIEYFLETDPDDMDYDNAIRRDDRTFKIFLIEKIRSKQIILNTFFYKENLKPIYIKIMLFVLQIDLYFFVNGLFYNEEYVNKIFELENDTFSKKAWRFIDNLFYAFIVGVIINYIIEFFFIEEKKIRVIFKREKDNIPILKNEMTLIMKDIEKRYILFIVITFIITIFTWYHISCFNNIYPHIKKEWLIFSLLIIICIQILSLLSCILETIIRFVSFKCKSERLYKLSLLLD